MAGNTLHSHLIWRASSEKFVSAPVNTSWRFWLSLPCSGAVFHIDTYLLDNSQRIRNSWHLSIKRFVTISRTQCPIATFIYTSEEMQYCQCPASLTPSPLVVWANTASCNHQQQSFLQIRLNMSSLYYIITNPTRLVGLESNSLKGCYNQVFSNKMHCRA